MPEVARRKYRAYSPRGSVFPGVIQTVDSPGTDERLELDTPLEFSYKPVGHLELQDFHDKKSGKSGENRAVAERQIDVITSALTKWSISEPITAANVACLGPLVLYKLYAIVTQQGVDDSGGETPSDAAGNS